MMATSRPIRILELRSVRGTGGGPEKTILTGAARTDPRRFAITVCYLRDARDPMFPITEWAARLPVDYVELCERHSLDPSVWPALRRLVREKGIDIVHAHDYKTDLLAWLLRRREGVVALSTAHGWTGHTRREQLYYYADKRLLTRFDQVIAVSGDIKSELLRAGGAAAKISVVLNGIDPARFRRNPHRRAECRSALDFEPHHVVVGGIGRLEPQKRFDLLLDACADLRRDHPDLRVVIAGDGSLRKALEHQAARLGLSSRCRFLGHTPDVSAVHHACDVFVQTSDYEGTPNAVLEAMALETPIVATTAGGTLDLIRDGVDALTIAPGSAAAVAAGVRTVLSDRPAAARRVASARRRVETDLSFEARMSAVERIYESLFRTRSRAAAPAAVPA